MKYSKLQTSSLFATSKTSVSDTSGSKTSDPAPQASEIQPQFRDSVAPKVISDNASSIMQRAKLWTDSHPELTAVLCDYVVQYSSQISEEQPEGVVDLIVEKEIANGWKTGPVAVHLSTRLNKLLNRIFKKTLR